MFFKRWQSAFRLRLRVFVVFFVVFVVFVDLLYSPT